jgi:hypothetical protein
MGHPRRLSDALQAFLIEEKGKIDFVGNRTECALLMLLRSWGIGFKDLRDEFAGNIEHVYGFSSERKMASVLISIDSGSRLYVKVIAPSPAHDFQMLPLMCSQLFGQMIQPYVSATQ